MCLRMWVVIRLHAYLFGVRIWKKKNAKFIVYVYIYAPCERVYDYAFIYVCTCSILQKCILFLYIFVCIELSVSIKRYEIIL